MTETQTAQILRHLEERGTITPMEALTGYGCFRLGARIYELRQRGYDIETEMVSSHGKRYARYRMKRKGAA